MGETKKNKWQVMIDHRVEKVMRRLDNTFFAQVERF